MLYTLSSPFILGLLLCTATASPLDKRDGDSTKARLKLVKGSSPRNGTIAMNNVMDRYGWAKPVSTHSYVESNPDGIPVHNKLATGGGTGSGSVVATPEVHDSEYLCPVTIGGQTLNLNVDTGSADLWVFNTALDASMRANREIYDPSKSPSYQEVQGATFSVDYGDGSQTYGKVGADTVEVGGVTAFRQAIGLPSALSSNFGQDLNSDGILGLAFQSTNGIKPEPQPTFFDNVASSLTSPVFTANLRDNTPGAYQFGVIDSTAYSGSIHYTPVDKSKGNWQFQTKAGASPGVADTGSSLLLLDDDIVRTYWAPVPGHTSDVQGIIFPCGTTLPDFQIQLGTGYIATIPGHLINYAPATSKAGYCFGGIQSNNNGGLNIFGDIMFNSQFVVFDAGNTQIGFAPHA